MVSSVSFVSTTNTARSLAGFVLLALALTAWRSPGSSEKFWCSEASCHSSGCKSRQQRSPVAVVVIPSNGEGDRSVGSLEVKALGGRAYRSDPYRRASNLTGRSKCVNQEA